jgi:hypothetical protein
MQLPLDVRKNMLIDDSGDGDFDDFFVGLSLARL